jgi:hypothetical protein
MIKDDDSEVCYSTGKGKGEEEKRSRHERSLKVLASVLGIGGSNLYGEKGSLLREKKREDEKVERWLQNPAVLRSFQKLLKTECRFPALGGPLSTRPSTRSLPRHLVNHELHHI